MNYNVKWETLVGSGLRAYLWYYYVIMLDLDYWNLVSDRRIKAPLRTKNE
jgi:hypothetical protein